MAKKDAITQMRHGTVAKMLHGDLSERIALRETAILKNLISHYRAQKLSNSPELMVGGIAELSALHSLLSELEREIQEGERVLESEINRPAQ